MDERALANELSRLAMNAPAAFSAAIAERCLRHARQSDDYRENERLHRLCEDVVGDIWSALLGEDEWSAFDRLKRTVATYYLTPLFRRTYVDRSSMPWMDGNSVPVQVTHYAALSYLHISSEMAARAAWYATEYMETTPPFEVEYQQRDLGILRAHGALLTFDQVAVSEEEQAEAATVLRMLREPLAQDTANR